jgi:GT2 family glycosyltransferase
MNSPESKIDVSGSIVLFKNSPKLVKEAIESFLKLKLSKKLFLVDNSPTDELRSLSTLSKDIEYIKTEKNLGFGKAHNIAIQRALTEAKYHLVLNPDIFFGNDVLEKIFSYMEANPDVGQIMPKICYPDGEIQRLCKLLPSPADLFLRRFFPWFPGAEERNKKYELQESGYDKIMNVPYLSGCFMFFRTSALKQVGLFDERIFMYIEDADITRRMHQKYKTLFFPLVTAYHHYAKGSYKSFKLMAYNIHGAFIYFNKWGWFFDRDRRNINQKVTLAVREGTR